MPLTKDKKDKVITSNKIHENDTGSVEVQVALLTERINSLSEHLINMPRTTIPAVVY